MLSNDISIGNFFIVKDKIKKIDINDIIFQIKAEKNNEEFLIPIKLEDAYEMLEKFGFKKNMSQADYYHYGLGYYQKWLQGHGNFCLNIPNTDEGFERHTIEFHKKYLEIDYLHEFQNAYKVAMKEDIDCL